MDATRGDGDGDDRRHYAVYARRAIAPDDVLVASIPKASCLSARTCSCAAALRAERLGGGLALNIAIMHERALGERSRWAGYFAVLPRRGERGLPMFWSEEQRRRLRGTDLLQIGLVPLSACFRLAPKRRLVCHRPVAVVLPLSRCGPLDRRGGLPLRKAVGA